MHHPTIAPYGAYSCRDERQVVIAVQNQREWRAFCEAVLGRVDLIETAAFATNTARCKNRGSLDAEIYAVFRDLTAAALTERLRRANIAYGSVNEVADLSRHPALRRVEVNSPAGPTLMPASPWRWRGEAQAQLKPAPGLDEQGGSVRREFGDSVG
jgi:crotonobetainyl-CoA:carnitine CoA-transferase CaiB-like acyl-CoA transferase